MIPRNPILLDECRKILLEARGDKYSKLICLMRYGSHLYGTETAESDLDYRGIAMPKRVDIAMGKIPKAWRWSSNEKGGEKNKAGDWDIEIYSLSHFLSLALKGETVALDMLHCNGTNLIEGSQEWMYLVQNRERFYTKSLKAFVGYARRQAAKYGIKGSRLAAIDQFITFLRPAGYRTGKLEHFWDELPITDHSGYAKDSPNGARQYEICGRIFQETASCQYACGCMEQVRDNYGTRAEEARRNEGIDWKAISHAMRAADEVEQILVNGEIRFPLATAGFLRRVKAGEEDFLAVVQPELEARLARLEKLSAESDLPEEPETAFWEEFAVDVTFEPHHA